MLSDFWLDLASGRHQQKIRWHGESGQVPSSFYFFCTRLWLSSRYFSLPNTSTQVGAPVRWPQSPSHSSHWGLVTAPSLASCRCWAQSPCPSFTFARWLRSVPLISCQDINVGVIVSFQRPSGSLALPSLHGTVLSTSRVPPIWSDFLPLAEAGSASSGTAPMLHEGVGSHSTMTALGWI